MDKKNSVNRYMTFYMSIGMCFGVSFGFAFGMIFFPDNMSLGMCFGLPKGMCIGMAVGSAKDKRLSEKMMTVCRIEEVKDSSDVMIYAIDKSGTEKEYRVTEKKMKEERFTVEDRVAEETDGSLVSLESR